MAWSRWYKNTIDNWVGRCRGLLCGDDPSRRLLQRAVEASSNGFVITDPRQPGNPIVYVNPAFERLTGYARRETVGTNGRLLQRGEFNQPGLEEIRAAVREQREGHAIVRNYRKDGSLFWNELHIAPLFDRDGTLTHFVGIQNDVTARMTYEQQLAHQAKHDVLTGLPNRSLFEDRLHQALIHANRSQREVAVVFVDLDHFKEINDKLGHEFGDRLLITVAERLTRCLRENDTVARQGGDEFVLILTDAVDPQAITQTLQRIIASIAQPVCFDGQELAVTCSVGASVYPVDGRDAPTLLKHADIAMYRAKEQGRNSFQFYTAALNARASERLSRENSLRRAIERGEFELQFQPRVDLRSGRITAVETLLLWRHPEVGLLPPADFMPLAEETGLSVALGEWVLHAACAEVRRWLDAGLPAPAAAVNLSPLMFRRHDLARIVERALAASRLPAQYLALEIPEQLVAAQGELALATLGQLRELGIALALDGFGTGGAALAELKQLPLDQLKIDPSFIRNISTDAGNAAIARSVIALAHNLGWRAIAEGVENAAQMAYLRAHGCDEMQGNLLTRPLPADEVAALLDAGRGEVGIQLPASPTGPIATPRLAAGGA
ncbi:MAG TPA: EAL domain-containing protein [Rhodocyclaceae bacterium]|nr:EAL domain-containing protein [Rhodocyclaceae bacterium]